MGLNIDMPRDSGHGTTNDGYVQCPKSKHSFLNLNKTIFSPRNTARRFFERPDIASKILGVPAELIWGVGEIWATLTSGHFINTELFEEFCEGWLEVYKESSIREENITFQSIFIGKMVSKTIL